MNAWLPNAIGFQVLWLAAVGGAGRGGWWWSGPLALIAFAAWQLPRSANARGDATLMAVLGGAGFALDSAWAWLEWMEFAQPVPWPRAAPVWIVSLWMGFALTLNHSLAMLKAHPAWAALFGAVGGPLSYLVAERAWGAVQLAQPTWQPLLALALAWAIVTPAALALAARLPVRGRRTWVPT